jgi:hypothetical protein
MRALALHTHCQLALTSRDLSRDRDAPPGWRWGRGCELTNTWPRRPTHRGAAHPRPAPSARCRPRSFTRRRLRDDDRWTHRGHRRHHQMDRIGRRLHRARRRIERLRCLRIHRPELGRLRRIPPRLPRSARRPGREGSRVRRSGARREQRRCVTRTGQLVPRPRPCSRVGGVGHRARARCRQPVYATAVPGQVDGRLPDKARGTAFELSVGSWGFWDSFRIHVSRSG